jgi:hypothetical protein
LSCTFGYFVQHVFDRENVRVRVGDSVTRVVHSESPGPTTRSGPQAESTNELQHARLLTGLAGAALIVVFLASLIAWFVTHRALYGLGALGSTIGLCGYVLGCWYLETRAKP